MSIVDSAIAHVLPALSGLTGRPFTVIVGHALESADSSPSVVIAAPGIGVRCEDGLPISHHERRLIEAMLHVIRHAEDRESRASDLEDRLIKLQRENMDLIVKNQVLSEVSARDALTGLYNRWYVTEKIDSEMNRALRHGSPVSLLMLDIDYFKKVNDEYGHPAGDEVLKSVGKVLKESCRVYDVPARYGGEEFCIILPETRTNNTMVVAERIRARLAGWPVPVRDDHEITVTASIGIAGHDITDEPVLNASSLIDRADRALYSAKHRGRNRVELWSAAMHPRGETLSH
jgi:diguanylate cyclase (GGDEF)-like protein